MILFFGEKAMDETDMSKKILGSQTDNEPEEKKTANWLADNVIWYVSKKAAELPFFAVRWRKH